MDLESQLAQEIPEDHLHYVKMAGNLFFIHPVQKTIKMYV